MGVMLPRAPLCGFSHGPPLPRASSLEAAMLAMMRSSSEKAPALNAEIRSAESTFGVALPRASLPDQGRLNVEDRPQAPVIRAKHSADAVQAVRAMPRMPPRNRARRGPP